MKKLELYIRMGKEDFKLEISLNITKNVFYKEEEILEFIHDMLKYYFGADPTILYKYIKDDYILTKEIK